MRCAFPPFQNQATVHEPGLQIAANQLEYCLVADPLAQPVHQDVVIHPVKELLQVHIDHHPVAVLHMALRLQHCVMRSPSRTKAVAVPGECRVDQRLQNLQHGLLDQPVGHGGYPQFTHPAACLGYLYPAYRLGPVAACAQRFLYLRPGRLQVFRCSLHRQSVHPRASSVGLDAFPRPDQILSCERLTEQVSPQAFLSVPRRPCVITFRFRLGFTSPSRVPPRYLGLLMLCTSKRHRGPPSFSFGPSLPVGSYYGLC